VKGFPQCLFKQGDAFLQIAAVVQRIRLSGRLAGLAGSFSRDKARRRRRFEFAERDAAGNVAKILWARLRYVRLTPKNLKVRGVKESEPACASSLGLNEADIDANLICHRLHAAFDYVLHIEFLPDLAMGLPDMTFATWERSRGDVPDRAGRVGCDYIGQAGAEIVLLASPLRLTRGRTTRRILSLPTIVGPKPAYKPRDRALRIRE